MSTIETYAVGDSDTLPNADYLTRDSSQTAVLNKVSWGAIFAGVVVALVAQVLLTC